jgi:hypothetical protein
MCVGIIAQGGAMNLYAALSTINAKITDTTTDAKYSQNEKEMLVGVLENQARISEELLILGSILTSIISKDIEIEIVPPKGSPSH